MCLTDQLKSWHKPWYYWLPVFCICSCTPAVWEWSCGDQNTKTRELVTHCTHYSEASNIYMLCIDMFSKISPTTPFLLFFPQAFTAHSPSWSWCMTFTRKVKPSLLTFKHMMRVHFVSSLSFEIYFWRVTDFSVNCKSLRKKMKYRLYITQLNVPVCWLKSWKLCNIITALEFLFSIHINKAEFFVCTDKELCIHINASVFLQFIQQQNII